MLRRTSRYALVALAALACQAVEESPVPDSSMATPGTTTRVSPGTPSVSPTDTAAKDTQRGLSVEAPDLPVRRAPSTTQVIVDTAGLSTIQAIVAHHPQRVDSTIRSMTEELKRTNRTPSATWTALHDSVKKDVNRLASIGDGEMVAFFRQHYARFLRLTQLTP